jgi:hypothetical protein
MFCDKIKHVQVDSLIVGDFICVIDIPCVILKVRKKLHTVGIIARDIFEWENYKITLHKNEFVIIPIIKHQNFNLVELSNNYAHLIGPSKEKIQVQINKYEHIVLEHALDDCEQRNSKLIVNVASAMGRDKIIHFKKEFIFF